MHPNVKAVIELSVRLQQVREAHQDAERQVKDLRKRISGYKAEEAEILAHLEELTTNEVVDLPDSEAEHIAPDATSSDAIVGRIAARVSGAATVRARLTGRTVREDILAVLRAHPGEVMTAPEIVEKAGLDPARTDSVRTALHRLQKDPEERVDRVRTGAYVWKGGEAEAKVG